MFLHLVQIQNVQLILWHFRSRTLVQDQVRHHRDVRRRVVVPAAADAAADFLQQVIDVAEVVGQPEPLLTLSSAEVTLRRDVIVVGG